MGLYLTCPQCGSINRDSDSNCFSCNADLTSVPPPPPPPSVPSEEAAQEGVPALDVRVSKIADGKIDQGRFKDLSSRYEAKPLPKMDSTVLHGLRSGLVAGMIVGAAMGVTRTQLADDFTTLIVRYYPKTPKDGIDVFLFTFLGDIFFGVILGMILGFINLLCWQAESARTGMLFGLLVACGAYYQCGVLGHPFTILIGVFHGYVLGWSISTVERKLFRKM
jgi:hypothetical protein